MEIRIIEVLLYLYYIKGHKFLYLIAMNMGSVMDCTCACGGVCINEDNGHQCTCSYCRNYVP